MNIETIIVRDERAAAAALQLSIQRTTVNYKTPLIRIQPTASSTNSCGDPAHLDDVMHDTPTVGNEFVADLSPLPTRAASFHITCSIQQTTSGHEGQLGFRAPQHNENDIRGIIIYYYLPYKITRVPYTDYLT